MLETAHIPLSCFTPSFHNITWQVLQCKGLMIYFLSWRKGTTLWARQKCQFSVNERVLLSEKWAYGQRCTGSGLMGNPPATAQGGGLGGVREPIGEMKHSARTTFRKSRLHPLDSSEISAILQAESGSGQTLSFLVCGNLSVHCSSNMERHLSP